MPLRKLFLFGTPRLEQDGQALPLPGRKLSALLAYLAATAQPQSRDRLATLFWPEFDQSTARANLRRELSGLRNSFDTTYLKIEREQVSLPLGSDLWLDVAVFQSRLHECQQHPHGTQEVCASCLPLLQEAADLYTADFLAGFSLSACPDFDEWQYFQAEGYRRTLATVLDRLAQGYLRQNQSDAALAQARRRLSLDSLHEPAQRQLITLYAETGNRTAALRQADLCVQLLLDELGAPPDAETKALIERLRHSNVTPVRKTNQQAFQQASEAQRAGHHNLPIQTTSFIGRTDEMMEIKRLLLDEPDCRLLNLVGPGGIGKTRLALAAATQMVDTFPDGAFFIPLAPISEVPDIVTAIAEALRFTFYGNRDPKDQLVDYLSQKQLLLVIDNFEHLLAGADLLSAILTQAPAVTLLTTARERLQLQEEWVYEVQGLVFPADSSQNAMISENIDPLDAYSAVQLFIHRARQTIATFNPTSDDLLAIGRICQLVEGMPLGIELSTPWIRTLSCDEIAAEIARSLDFLTTSLRNVAERHRSLRIVFEQTWARLSQAAQGVLMKLSVFRGGFTREAAAVVAGATLSELSSLVDKALLRRTNVGRYELHELIRQFAEMQLTRDPEAVEQTQQRHQDYFITFLESRTAGVKGRRQLATLAEIEADIDNVRLAWRRAAAKQDAAAIERAAECLFVYYLYRNGYDEGQAEFRRAVAAIADLPDRQADDSHLLGLVAPVQKQALVGYLLASLGYFVAHRRNLPQGQRLLEQALALLQQTASVDRYKEAFALLWLGWAFYFQGKLTEGKRYAKASFAFFTETEDSWARVWALMLLGGSLRDGRPAEALAAYQPGLTLCRESGDQISLSYISFNIGAVATMLGDYTQAQQHIELGVTISEQLNNILGLGYSLLRRGQLEIAQGKYQQATQTLHQSWTHFNKVGIVHASRAQFYLGLAHHLQGDDQLAAQRYEQALHGFTTANNLLERVHCFNGLGCLAYKQGKLQQAEQIHRESLALLQESEPEPAIVAATLRHLGQAMAALDQHRWAEARATFRHALTLAMTQQLAPIALDICVNLAQLLVQTGEITQAIELLTLAEQHVASTFATREKAHQLLVTLLAQTPPEAEQVTRSQGRQRDLWSVVQELLTTPP